ncbi:hypothetical protein Tco_0839344 [Tanacetum coccineum]|uniref:Reverse transcriptase domain-containing protein n=1 Tax=Tanacetum coccineum TaxID=301880 RepID=A0ABQ5AT61_9ASTR
MEQSRQYTTISMPGPLGNPNPKLRTALKYKITLTASSEGIEGALGNENKVDTKHESSLLAVRFFFSVTLIASSSSKSSSTKGDVLEGGGDDVGFTIFDHVSDKCPKLPKEVSNVQLSDDGFTEVIKKKTKAKKNNKKQVEGVRLTKPALNLQYRRVDKGETSKQKVIPMENVKNVVNGSSKPLGDPIKVSTQNSFSALEEDDSFSDIGRGMNLSPKQSEIRHVIFENKLSVCAILESHVANRNLDRLCTHVFKHWKWVSNASSCLKGTRIIVGWNHDDVDVSVIHQESQVIHTRIWIKADKKEFFCSFVYAHNYYIHRRPLWSSLCLHKRYINNRPWCLLGDFNASLFVDDTSIGPSSLDITMREFKECVETMEVMDVQRTGLHFTWNQKPKVHAIFKPYRISDHSPSVLSIPSRVKLKPKPFKFFNVAILDKRFKGLVRDGWSSHVSGFDMFRVVKKLKGLKKPIRKMMYDKGNLHANVIRLRENHDRLQADLDSDPSNVTIREEEAAAVVAFNEALLLAEKLLKQKAKITWLREGTTTEFDINNLFSTRLDANEALDMIRGVSSQEVKSAMFSMGNDKSPGPDGYTAAFFKDTWDIIGSDVTKAVCEFFTNGRLLKELNHTIIALIPKVNAPARVNDYRPISCCNVLFKCISKIIANRLKDCLKRLISPNQSAFVPGRSIADNILLTQEIMHNYHLDRGVPRCAFKVDIQKAYDTVDWEFLRAALIGFGFHDRMISWIMECVSTTSFSISINGSLHGFFKGKRGLRQATVRIGVNNMFFVDGFVFAFCLHGDVLISATIIKEALDEFKDASGLNPSMPKSKAYFCNVLNHTKLAILLVLPFEEDRLPVKYLGVPLVSSRLIFRDCKELIDKVQNRVNDWKNKSLSFAGRLQLIQSVLGSLNVFWASVFALPSRVLLDIEQIMRGFLWCQGGLSRGKAKVAWEVVCLPKKEGGLGIRRLDHFNKALMVSHIWKLLSLKESLWVKIHHTYLDKSNRI